MVKLKSLRAINESDVLNGRLPIRYVFLALFCITTTLAFYAYQLAHPSCAGCDDEHYRLFAQFFVNGTPLPDRLFRIRTFGYPALLALLLALSRGHALVGSALIMSVQLAAYIASAWFLYRVLQIRYSVQAARFVLSGLLINVLAFPYLGLSLTDGPSLILAVCMLALLLLLVSDAAIVSVSRLLTLGFLLGLTLGFGVMVRPANIHWAPVCFIALLSVAYTRGTRNLWTTVQISAAAAFGFFVAVFPQMMLNMVAFHRHTFLPVYNLGDMQVDFGVKYLKYGTRLVGPQPQMPYLNPWYRDGKGIATISWYFSNPFDGLKTIFYHVFGALDFDYLFPYIYDLEPWYRPALFLFCHTIIFWGIAGFMLLGRRARLSGVASIETLAVILITVYFISWAAIYALSAVENRFALPLVTICIPLALMALSAQINQKRVGAAAALFLVYLLCAGYLSHRLALTRL